MTPGEVAILLQSSDTDVLHSLFQAAKGLRRKYTERGWSFAPLYISNHCVNGCVYCGYRKERQSNKAAAPHAGRSAVGGVRSGRDGAQAARCRGWRGPQHCPIEYVLDTIKTIYSVKEKTGSIRRVNVNIAATTVEDYRKLKDAGIGTYILFQETYHRDTYRRMHPAGPKRDYDWHTLAMDRAMEGGIDDVGMGVLYGLYDYKFEVLATLLACPSSGGALRCRPAYSVSSPDKTC